MSNAIEQAETLFADGQADQARTQLESLLTDQPDNSRILNDLGVIAYSQEDHQAAESFFTRAAQADPDNQQSLRNLADLYQSENRWAEMAATLLQLRKLVGDRPDLLNELAVAMLEMKQVGGAIEMLNRSLEIEPEQPEVRQSLQAILETTGATR
jgi:Flp pilus assembly protein TadD